MRRGRRRRGGLTPSAMAPQAPEQPTPLPRGVRIASYLLMAGALLLVMAYGLLSGLLCACLGFLLTRWLAPRFKCGGLCGSYCLQ